MNPDLLPYTMDVSVNVSDDIRILFDRLGNFSNVKQDIFKICFFKMTKYLKMRQFCERLNQTKKVTS